jgi:hypothetical protein
MNTNISNVNASVRHTGDSMAIILWWAYATISPTSVQSLGDPYHDLSDAFYSATHACTH